MSAERTSVSEGGLIHRPASLHGELAAGPEPDAILVIDYADWLANGCPWSETLPENHVALRYAQAAGIPVLPIVVTDVQPGFVDTRMAGGNFWMASPEKAARQIAAAIRGRKRACVRVRAILEGVAYLLRRSRNISRYSCGSSLTHAPQICTTPAGFIGGLRTLALTLVTPSSSPHVRITTRERP